MDFTFDFIKAMNKRRQKFFALIDIISITHKSHFGGQHLDVPYYQFFSQLFAKGLAVNTVIIFFSDHGIRLGPLRETHSGEVETRLPFMFIRLPENSDQNYVKTLRQNKYRLTSPFDIHATLVHLLKNKPDHSLPHGLSLIDRVLSDKRDCTSAAIPQPYCSCYENIPVLDYSVIHPNETIPKIIAKINSYSNKWRKRCVEFKLEKIKRIYQRIDHKYPGDVGEKIFMLHVYVKPGNGIFKVYVEGSKRNTQFNVIDEIVRINRYGRDARCIPGEEDKKYCYCRNLINVTEIM